MRLAIIGLGLIGGSLGMALKRDRGPEVEIVGYARHREVADRAKQLGAIDYAGDTLALAAARADIVFICTPVRAVEQVLQDIADHITSDCLVTDAASTKEQVVGWAEMYLPPGSPFVGGHPMAGKELFGIEAADPNLFKGCIYCLTPSDQTLPRHVDMMRQMVKWVGATPFIIDARQHDFMVAGISHLPALISAALVEATTRSSDWPVMAKLASTGYRDVTRLASGSPEVLGDIVQTNREAIIHWIDEFSGALQEFRAEIADPDRELEDILARIRQVRQEWLEIQSAQRCSQ
jgi:prephenate dehydrogenase